ncbi:armadillo repeat-containing protein 7 isoform X2 [Globicephala melas]|nr:armadillo repeat-containing protein 7 isoform X3 [Globicephala melas]
MAQKPKVDPHVGRLGYLQALVTEFQATESQDAKEQVLANLANFAYDPSNYQYLRQLQVLDLFLDSLSEENETLVEFAIGSKAWGAGLCRSIWHRKMLFATGTDKLGQHQVVSIESKSRVTAKEKTLGTSPVAQWLRIHLPVQGTQVRALVREDPTCYGATKPVCHNY